MRGLLSLFLIALSFFIVSGCNDNENNGISNELKLLLDDIVKCTMLEKQLPGLSVTALKNGRVIYQEAFGKADIEADIDAKVDTQFAIASMTKIFTTFSVMQLIDDGLVDLDDPIGMYLPNLPNDDWNTLTIRNLLSMSSGMPELAYCTDGETNESVCEDVSVDGKEVKFNVPCMGTGFECVDANRVPYMKFINDAGLIPVQFDGGAKYFYSNTNFLVLGELIETLSGKSYETYLRENVLLPLGMTNTRPNNVPPPVIADLAIGYKHVKENTGPQAVECITFNDAPDNCSTAPPQGVKCEAIPTDELRLPAQSFSAGWLISTQPDMAKLENALNSLSPVLMSPESYVDMWTNTVLNDGMFERFGLGWGVCSELFDQNCPVPLDPLAGGDSLDKIFELPTDEDGLVVYKDGALAGYSSIIVRYLDDGITVVVFDNIKAATEGELKFAPLDLASEIAVTLRENGI